jgi:hypothetical protein
MQSPSDHIGYLSSSLLSPGGLYSRLKSFSVDSGAARYLPSVAFFLATTSATVTWATTRLGIARNTLTATTTP